MSTFRFFFALILLAVSLGSLCAAAFTPPVTDRSTFNFNADWNYFQGDASGAQAVGFNDAGWTQVGLPHITKLVSEGDTLAYIGISWYRKHFTVNSGYQGRKVYIEFGAAMQVADVYVNGTLAVHHEGGYTPFTADVTSLVNYGGADNVIAVKIDSSANANWAPGWAGVDFQYHGGLYRNVTLMVTNPLHVTDAVYANQVASGGIFVTYPVVTSASATVRVKTHVLNEAASTKSVSVLTTLVDASGNVVQSASSTVSLPSGSNTSVSQDLTVPSPNLWHPNSPYLYTLHTVIQDGSANVDYVSTRIGIRRIQWLHSGLSINGALFKAMGADYHQDVYQLGNAMPKTAIYNDVKRIKNAGMDFIRGSHYPRDPAFYDACDELGVLVMDSITGWQNFSDTTAFKNNTYQECRDMIRRSRNHPSIVVWETSLNESNYSTDWAQTIHAIAHAEYPGDQAYTAGWATSVFDIYCASSQAGVRNSSDSRPIIIDEYGSWDYGGINSSSDVTRENTETKLLQQCTNLAESLNANRSLSWYSADAYWVFGDYAGYLNNTLNHCGVVDYSRIPKFSYYFYKSQRDPAVAPIANVDTGPMVYIANYWQPGSPTTVRVFSNCAQVSLYLNNVLIATQSPDTNYSSLAHPPFTFTVGSYAAGSLRADGLIGGNVVATQTRRTAGTATQIVLRPEGSTSINADGGDSRLIFMDVVDANGQVVPTATNTITLTATGSGAKIIGPASVSARAGQAAAWVQASRAVGSITVTATSSGLTSASTTFTAVAVPGLDPLSVPTAPSGMAGTTANGKVNLSWVDNSVNEASFLIEHSTDNVNFTPVATVGANVLAASFSESDSATYYYRVKAQNGAGASPASNVISLGVVAAVTTSAWTYADIGSVGAAGSSTVSSSTGSSILTINASGADIWNNADAFGYYYVQRTGDFQVITRVNSVQNTHAFAKAGVMIRNTLDPASAHALVDLAPTGTVEFIQRPTAGASSTFTSVANQATPQWVRLVRSGNTFSAAYSADGLSWNSLGSPATIPMATTVYLGLAVTSHVAGTLCAATFDNLTLIQGGWTDRDIGAVNILGNGVVAGTNAATIASGGDIWNNADAFHYTYQSQTGNFALSARVMSVSNTHNVAKAGVMIRNTLDPGSAHALVNLTPSGVAEFIQRTTSGGNSSSTSAPNQPAPQWVRLVRVGDTFRGYVSSDGLSWSQVGTSVSIPMSASVYLGVAATSHNNAALSSASYQNIAIELPGTLGFTASASSVLETNSSATITVSRSSGSIGPVSLNYATTTGGTATAGTNYTAVSGTLTWADGDTAAKTFTVPILNDNVSGPNKTVALSLTSPANGATLGTSSQFLTILENPTQNWRFAKFGANANNAAIAGDLADPDGDGKSNLLEYALGTNPNSSASIPALAIIGYGGGWKLNFARNALANDVTILLETSSDLVQWNPAIAYRADTGWIATAPGATATESAIAGSGVDQAISVSLTIPDVSAGASPKQFFRLNIARP